MTTFWKCRYYSRGNKHKCTAKCAVRCTRLEIILKKCFGKNFLEFKKKFENSVLDVALELGVSVIKLQNWLVNIIIHQMRSKILNLNCKIHLLDMKTLKIFPDPVAKALMMNNFFIKYLFIFFWKLQVHYFQRLIYFEYMKIEIIILMLLTSFF